MTRLARFVALDVPRSRAEWADRLGEALRHHETALCAALALGLCVEIWIGVVRSAALWGGP